MAASVDESKPVSNDQLAIGYWLLAIGYYAGFMFTGLVEEVGSVIAVSAGNDGTELKIAAPRIANKMQRGDSVTVNGCCLTVSSRRGNTLHFHLLAETIACTNLGNLQHGDSVNLERALGANERLGGHFVQGHVDCVSRVVAFRKTGADFRLEIELPSNVSRYVAPQDSIAVTTRSPTDIEHPLCRSVSSISSFRRS